MNAWTMMRHPSAFLPIVSSIVALATVLGKVAMFGSARGADEGAAAHVFQLLIAIQLPIVAYFAIKWLRRNPRQAALVLAIQAGPRSRPCPQSSSWGSRKLDPVFFVNI